MGIGIRASDGVAFQPIVTVNVRPSFFSESFANLLQAFKSQQECPWKLRPLFRLKPAEWPYTRATMAKSRHLRSIPTRLGYAQEILTFWDF